MRARASRRTRARARVATAPLSHGASRIAPGRTVDRGAWFDGPPRFDIPSNGMVEGTRGNAYGLLRGNTNQNPAPRLTRRNAVCDDPLPWFGGGVTNATWGACLARGDFLAFWDCMDAGIDGPHPFGHIWLGGAWGAADGNCTAKQLDGASAEIVGGCLVVVDCAGLPLEACVLARNASACDAMAAPTGARCQRYGGGGGRPDYEPDGACKRCGAACDDAQLGANGDFWDGSTSTNDPARGARGARAARSLSPPLPPPEAERLPSGC